MSDQRIVRTLRLSRDEMSRVMQGLDAAHGGRASDPKRSHKRWKLRGSVAVVSVVDEHGNRTNYAVAPRDLSGSGFGALNGTFIHPGTACSVGLYKLNGEVASIDAVVARCRLLRAGVHELGIRFLQRINPMEFIAFDGEQVFQIERVDLENMRGTLLYVCESRVEQRLMAHQFVKTQVDLLFAPDGEAGCAQLEENPDLIYVDHAVDDWSGVQLIGRMREIGAACPIVMLTSDKSPAVREDAIDCGADDVLVRPLSSELLHQATAEFLEKRADMDELASAHFTLVSASKLGVDLELIEDFVAEMHGVAVDIEAALQEDDRETIRKRALSVRGRSESFGFGSVGRVADALLEAVATGDEDSIFESAARLRSMCGRCRAVE